MIFFIHVPKTAGTTFYEVVANNYGQFLKPKVNDSDSAYLEEKLDITKSAIRLPGGYETAPLMLRQIGKLSNLVKDNINFIGGHVGYGYHELSNIPVNYISFLRHPKDRLFSDFKEQCKEGRHFYDALKIGGFRFNDYLNLIRNNHLDNILTRQLAGPFDFYLNKRAIINRKLFEKAKSNSGDITFFNMENFDEALFYIQREYKWKNLRYTIKNKSHSTEVLVDYDENLLTEIIKYDLQLMDSLMVVNNEKFSKMKKLIIRLKNL